MERTRDELKNKFRKGDKPTELDYADVMDSFVSKLEDPYFKANDLPEAKTNARGIVEQATLMEVDAGTDNERFVTPEGVKRAVLRFAPDAPVASINGETGAVTIPDHTKDVTPWNSVNFSNGVSAIGNALRYKRKLGIVYFEGELSINSTTSGNTNLFSVLTGFRPTQDLAFYVVGSTGVMVRIVVNRSGSVVATNIGNNLVNISLSGISYIAS